MKPIVTLAFASLCAIALFASCTKEILVEQGNSTTHEEGTRVIAVSFGTQTRTTLDYDGLTPQFKYGDEILVANGVDKPQTCKVEFDKNKNPIITTRLKGALTAVYPAKYAEVKGGEIDGWNIPTVQSGKFSEANICYSEMDDDESSLYFENCCPILRFYVDESIGVKSIKITSSIEYIAGNSKTITVEAPEGNTLYDVMPGDEQDKRICYVAIDGREVYSKELTFESETTTQGIVARTPTSHIELEYGKMYNAFIPYYIEVNVGTQESPIYQKWGYCNIGAFLPEDNGYYFSWGNTDGHTADYAFTADNYANTQGNELAEGVDIAKGSKYDAAFVNWGSNWRMPDYSELSGLMNASSNLSSHQISGQEGYYCFNGKIFLPAIDGSCSFWSSSADNKSNSGSWSGIEVDSDGKKAFTSGEEDKHLGMTIRPIYEEPVAIPGEFTINSDGKKVKFAKGLLYWDGDSFEFEENQLAYATTWDASHISHFYWSKSESVARASSYSDASASANDVLFTNATETTATPNFTVNGETGKYRALSQGEMEYLIQNNICYNKVTIGDDYFIVIATPNCSDKLKYSYTIEEWAEAEKAGLISIPYGGWRSNNDIKSRNSYMYIYTASPKGSTDAYSVLYYTDGRCWLDHTEPRCYGYIIRLVCDVDNK